jgi:galactonate dehydratase
VTPENIDRLAGYKQQTQVPIAAGERLYTLADFDRLIHNQAVDVVQMDLAHCGGILCGKKIAAMAAVHDIRVAPHCSIGPVALAACLHFDVGTPNFMIQEAFTEFDVSWRDSLVAGWNPVKNGDLLVPEGPGLGIDIDPDAIARHPYVQNAFPGLWDKKWLDDFTPR